MNAKVQIVYEITISDIVNIGLFLVAVFGIILTFFTLKEMKNQRILSIRPLLVFDDIEERELLSTDNPNYFNPFDFRIRNVGNGIASDINISVQIDSDFFVKDRIVSETKDDVSIKIEAGNAIVYTEISKVFNQYVEGCQLLIPGEEYRIHQFEKLNGVYWGILIEIIKGSMTDQGHIMDITVEYRDILENKYMSKYEVYLYASKTNNDKINFRFDLKKES